MSHVSEARSRLALALGLSALLHGWLMHNAQGLLSAPRVIGHGAVPLIAVLSAPQRDALAPAAGPHAASESAQIAATAPHWVRDYTADVHNIRVGPTSVDLAMAQPVARAEQSHAPLPQPNDPTYYGALSLDVYPKAITALDLGAQPAHAAARQVRATVLIDEAGIVNEVRAIQAAATDIESAARTLLLQTRFTPARKDGRVVKAQLQVSLDYAAR